MVTIIYLISICLFGVFPLQVDSQRSAARDLNIMLIVSFGQSGLNSSGVIPAANIALEDINRDPNVLSGYNLKYDKVRDSQCHRGRSLDAFFDGIQSDPVKLAVFGCGCSPATEPVAEISYRWNIPQISYASTLAALSDRTRFRGFFRNDLPIASPALRSTMEKFGWKRIVLLTQDENLFTVAESTFRSELEPAGIRVESRTFRTTEDPIKFIRDIFVREKLLNVEMDYRIFFLNSYSGIARKIICYAQKENYTSPRYVWMVYDWYPPKWWTLDRSRVEVNCTDRDLTYFIESSLSFQWRPVADDANSTTDTGKSLMLFEAEYEERGKATGYNTFTHGSRIYDALWALAFALDKTMTMVDSVDIKETGCENSSGSLVPLHEFNYTNEKMGCLIQWSLHQSNFSGLTGNVRFDENGTRIYPNVRVLQYQREGLDTVRKRLALLDISHNYSFNFVNGADNSDIFPAGIPPDGTPINITHTFRVELVSFFDITASLGILFAVVCLVFNIIFRNKKVVRLTSPNLNYFIIGGAISMYMSIYFCLLPGDAVTLIQARCAVHHLLFIIGYSFAFGSVLVKMWRVYHIFNNPQPNKKILTDWHLIGTVLVVTGIVVLLLFLEETVAQLRGTVVLERDMEEPYGISALGVREINYVWTCYEEPSPSFYWQLVIFVYLTILQIVGIVLAFQTRKVKLQGLRDSKYIAVIVYISTILLVALAVETFTLRQYINIGASIIAGGIFVLTTVFLALIFIPKMIILWRDPEGNTVSVMTTKSLSQTAPGNVEVKKIASLERAVDERDNRIVQLELEINELKSIYQIIPSTLEKDKV